MNQASDKIVLHDKYSSYFHGVYSIGFTILSTVNRSKFQLSRTVLAEAKRLESIAIRRKGYNEFQNGVGIVCQYEVIEPSH